MIQDKKHARGVVPDFYRRNAAAMLLVCIFAGVLALPFCLRTGRRPAPETGSGSTSAPPRKLVIISPHWEGVRREFGRAFSEWTERNLGHKTAVEWMDVGGTSDDVRYIRSEFRRTPDGIKIDLFFGGGIDPYIQLKKEGLLTECDLPSGILEKVPAALNGVELFDPGHQWFGACLGGFGIIYNRKVLELLRLPAPREWADLAGPDYFSWVGSGDPRSSGSVHMCYEIILQAYGWEKGWEILIKMGGNIRAFSRSGSDIPKDTALGEVACGLAIDVYAWRQAAEAGEDKIGFVMPDALTVINPDGIAILKGAPDPGLAGRFIEFVLSENGQKLWTLKKGTRDGPKEFELGRLSIIPGFAAARGKDAAVPLDPYLSRAGFTYDPAKGALRWTILNDMIGCFLIDPHADLAAAWKKISSTPDHDPARTEFLKPPAPEDEAMRLASSEWNNPESRTRICAGWAAQARDRYRKALEKTK